MSEKIEPVAWAMTDYQPEANTQYTGDKYAAEHWGSQGIQIEPLYSATTVSALEASVADWERMFFDMTAARNAETEMADALEARVKAALAVVEKMDIAASADRKDSIKPPRLGGAELTSSEYSNLANIQDHWAKMLRQALTGATKP